MSYDFAAHNAFDDNGSDDDEDVTVIPGRNNLRQVDEAIFGKLDRNKRERIENIDIFAIEPDHAQPRRAIPASIRGDWLPNAPDMPDFLAHWIGESGLDVRALVAGDESARPEKVSGHAVALLKIIDLAATIRRDGLLNPASVVKSGDGLYEIETGERRWLSYHLLHWLYGGEEWARIPARVMHERDPFRQANENNQRDSLNVIGKARQYAILLMAMHPDVQFVPYAACESDRAYYAQAMELKTPYGRGGELMAAMGIKNRNSVAEYKKLLTLDDAMWQEADEVNHQVRPLLRYLETGELSGAPDNSDDDEPIGEPVSGADNPNIPSGDEGEGDDPPALPENGKRGVMPRELTALKTDATYIFNSFKRNEVERDEAQVRERLNRLEEMIAEIKRSRGWD